MKGSSATSRLGTLTVADRIRLRVKYGVSRATLNNIARICRDRQAVEQLLAARHEHGLPPNPLWQG